MHIDMALNERMSTLVKLCSHWPMQPLLSLARMRPHPCVHANTHAHNHTETHCLLYLPSTELTGWHHLQLQCQRVIGDHRLAAQTSCPSILHGYVSLCCQRDSVTSLIKFAIPGLSLYAQYYILCFYFHHCFHSPLLASSFFPLLLLASPLPPFF